MGPHETIVVLICMYAYFSSWIDASGEWRNGFGLSRPQIWKLGDGLLNMDRDLLHESAVRLIRAVRSQEEGLNTCRPRQSVRVSETALRAARDLYSLEVIMCHAREKETERST